MKEQLKLLESRLREIVSAMIAKDGEMESGVYNYYARKLEDGRPMLTPYDVAIPRHILPDEPDMVHYAGPGLGFMAIVCALMGISVHCYESDNRRFKGMMRVREEIAKDFPQVPTFMNATCRLFPAHDMDLSRDTNMLLFGNFAATTPDELRDQIISSFNLFDAVILNESRFCGNFDEESDQRAMLHRIAAGYRSTRTPLEQGFSKYQALR